MDVSFNTSTKDYKAISEAIEKLGTLKERLQYYNDNYRILIIPNGAFSHLKVNILQYDKLKIFCTCNDCKDLYSTDDFEVYRDFVNNQTDAIVKYFNDTTDYKAKLEYYYKLNDGYPQKTILTLKYVPNTIDEVKDYYNLKETSIDVTPQTEIEFNILLEFVKKSVINSTSRVMNYNYLIFENRVNEIRNYLEFITDENDRKDLIKKYLDEINLDKIDVVELKKQRLTNKYYIPEILKITDKIIQKNTFEKIIDKTNFRDAEHYLLALETIKFKKFLNSLNKEPQQSSRNNNENKIWFKVGLLFATGEMYNLINDFSSNATQIANHLNNKSYRPYITESISKTNNNDKNIFSNRFKMQSIIDYCSLNNVEVSTEFIKHLPTE